MCQRCSSLPTAAGANGVGDFVWDLFSQVMGLPGRVSGMVLNAVVNTIDKVQTDAVIKETRSIIERESANAQSQAPEEKPE
jgi:hypothetical protein